MFIQQISGFYHMPGTGLGSGGASGTRADTTKVLRSRAYNPGHRASLGEHRVGQSIHASFQGWSGRCRRALLPVSEKVSNFHSAESSQVGKPV